MVDFPDPDNPVNQNTRARCPSARSRSARESME
jgi:hypothetical protein